MNIIIHLDKDRGKNCIKVCECFDLQKCIILLFKMNVLALADFFGNVTMGTFLSSVWTCI